MRWVIFAWIFWFAGTLSAEVIELKGGDILKGAVVESAPDFVVIEHPVLGRTRIPRAAIAQLMSNDEAAKKQASTAPATMPAATTVPAPEDAAKIAAAAKAKAEAWKRQVEVGANGSRGDTRELSLYLAFKATQKDDEGKWAADMAYNRRENNDAVTRDDFTAGILHDWYFGKSPWFLTASGRYDYNNFTDYQHRVQGSVGPGYRILNDEKFDWLVRSGLGARKQWASDRLTPSQHNDFEEHVVPEVNIGTQFTWRITKRQVFDAGTTFYFDLLDPRDNRLISNADWQVKVDPEHNLSFKVGVANEYRSEVIRPSHYNNFKFYAALVYGF